MPSIELALAEPNPVMLQALADIFDKAPGFSVVFTVRTAEALIEAVQRMPVPIAIIDWQLPRLGGERVIAQLRALPTGPRVVVYGQPGDGDLARKALAAGAAGFCSRGAGVDQLVDVTRSVAKGQMVFPFLDIRALRASPVEQLTARERVLLWALARGRTNKQLATELNISVNTVKFHLANLYQKLALANRAEAVAFFYAQGLGATDPAIATDIQERGG
jgi:DNA-binding NarL/FixJ family response regulator